MPKITRNRKNYPAPFSAYEILVDEVLIGHVIEISKTALNRWEAVYAGITTEHPTREQAIWAIVGRTIIERPNTKEPS